MVAVLASTSLAAVAAEAHAYTYDPSIRAYDVSPRVTPGTDVSELKQRPATPHGPGVRRHFV